MHTLGPWRVESRPDIAFAYVYGARHPDGGDYAPLMKTTNRDDAHLIAAAPELLQALKNLAQSIWSSGLPFDTVRAWTDEAKAAIAKAEGRA